MTTYLLDQFDEYVRRIYDDPPAKGTDQHMQLQDAFMGGALIAHQGDAPDLIPELRDYQRTIEMRAEFDDGKDNHA